MASMPMASIVSTVSRSDSPFFTDDVPTLKVIVSADRRLAAVSKLTGGCGSSPRRRATRRSCPAAPAPSGWRRLDTSTKVSVSRSTSSMPSAPEVGDREEVLRGASLDHLAEVDAVVVDVDDLVAAGREVLADVVGPDRQLAVAAVDHHRQLHRPGPAVVVEGVEGGPDRAAGEEHVVDEDDDRAVDVEGDVGDRLGQDRPQADVVAVEGDVERADRRAARRRSPRGSPARRRASGTPPVCSPTRTTSSRPWLRSMISWAMRQSARWTSSASITRVRATKTPPYGGVVRRSRSAIGLVSPVRAGLTGPASRSGADPSAAAIPPADHAYLLHCAPVDHDWPSVARRISP